MITREEYNKALDIVEAYQKQIFTTKIEDELERNSKTKVRDWDKLSSCSTRLYNILTGWIRNNFSGQKFEIEYIEDITKKSFKKHIYAGQVSWTEFKELRGY